jgi:hypothetical protein
VVFSKLIKPVHGVVLNFLYRNIFTKYFIFILFGNLRTIMATLKRKWELEERADEIKKIRVSHCIKTGCFGPTHFGYEKGKPLYCNKHKTSGCLNMSKKMCEEAKCITFACFGGILKTPLYCKLHKRKDDFNVLLDNKCQHVGGCGKSPFFGPVHGNQFFCREHAGPEDVFDSRKKYCKSDDCLQEVEVMCVSGIRMKTNFCINHSFLERKIVHIELKTEAQPQPQLQPQPSYWEDYFDSLC